MANPVLAWGWHGLTPTMLFYKSKSMKSTCDTHSSPSSQRGLRSSVHLHDSGAQCFSFQGKGLEMPPGNPEGNGHGGCYMVSEPFLHNTCETTVKIAITPPFSPAIHSRKGPHLRSGRSVPNLDELVARPAHDVLPVRRERKGDHPASVTALRALWVDGQLVVSAGPLVLHRAEAAASAGVPNREHLPQAHESALATSLVSMSKSAVTRKRAQLRNTLLSDRFPTQNLPPKPGNVHPGSETRKGLWLRALSTGVHRSQETKPPRTLQ